VGELHKSPGEAWDVCLVQIRILLEVSGQIQKSWSRISSPVKGWVEWKKLGISESGFLGELIEIPGDFKEIAL